VREADLANASTVLVLAPPVEDDPAARADLLASADPDRLIVVPVGSTPAAWGDVFEHPALSATQVSYVDVKTAVSTAADAATDGPEAVATISSPADLATLGSVLNDGLAHAVETDECVCMSLDSVSDMLGFVDREFLFRFLHTLGARVHRVDGVAYYHLDADADEELRSLFVQICDAVVTVDDEVNVAPGFDAVDAPK